MKLALHLGPVHIMAANDERLIVFFLGSILQGLTDSLIVSPGIVFLVPFRTSGVISRISIAAAVARQGIGNGAVFVKMFKLDLEKTRTLTVHQRNPQPWVFRKNRHQRFQMEALVDIQLSGCDSCRHIKLVPNPTRATRKHNFAPRLVSMQAFGKIQNAFEVRNSATKSTTYLQFLNRPADQVFCQDSFFAVRLILRSRRFEIKADREFIGTAGFERGKLSQLFTRNHEAP